MPAAAQPPLRLTDDDLKAVIKDVNKKDKFAQACAALHDQVTHHAFPRRDALFTAVLRVGTVLKTRHAEGSAAWRLGLSLFEEAAGSERFINGREEGDVGKLRDLVQAARATTDAADAEPENNGDGGGSGDALGAGRGRADADAPRVKPKTHNPKPKTHNPKPKTQSP